MIEEIGYKYTCDVCGAQEISSSRPDGWTKGFFHTEAGYSFGHIVICKKCFYDDCNDTSSEVNNTFRKLWNRLGWGKKKEKKS